MEPPEDTNTKAENKSEIASALPTTEQHVHVASAAVGASSGTTPTCSSSTHDCGSATTTAKEGPAEEAARWEERVQIVREHYERKGYLVRSGLQFGCELVLYADDPSKVHSDFCVHVVPEGRFSNSLT